MIPKTVDLTTLVGSIKGLDSEAITKQIIEDREEDQKIIGVVSIVTLTELIKKALDIAK